MNSTASRALLAASAVLAGIAAYFVVRPSEDAVHQPIGLANDTEVASVPLTTRKIDRRIGILKQQLIRRGESGDLLVQLGSALLQRVQETGDFSGYSEAGRCFRRAAALSRNAPDAIAGLAEVAAGQHRFDEALALADSAIALAPHRSRYFGLRSDALLELGRYGEAAAAVDSMLARRPGLDAYARVAYVRELGGDIPGAIEAMQLAVNSGVPGAAETEWCRTQLGHLLLRAGEPRQARHHYATTLHLVPGFKEALLGLARAGFAEGKFDEAEYLYSTLTETSARADWQIEFGRMLQARGANARADARFELARQLLESETADGIRTEFELASLNAHTGDLPKATLALARTAFGQRPTLYAADVLAWSLYQNGQFTAAERYATRAIRSGTIEPEVYYHAAEIARALGQPELAAQRLAKARQSQPLIAVPGLFRGTQSVVSRGYELNSEREREQNTGG